jgi:hypothetical protein
MQAGLAGSEGVERNLLEITPPMYPGERLMACRNPSLALRRAQKREELLVATEIKLRVGAKGLRP